MDTILFHPNFIQMETAVYLVAFAILLHSVDGLYHHPEAKAVKRIKNFRSLKDLSIRLRNSGVGAKRFDNVIGLFPFLSTWALIIAAVLVSLHFHTLLITVAASFFISTRMRRCKRSDILQRTAHCLRIRS
jgi:hypothetical protein